ncbi:hypothetical protein L0B53_17015 [Vibrio sp. SS-MA-C1-2]|uniref:hypothetical protein n=1 Tax=Vibrio sp. SS-MA-C1-2 TaxID=2908646 RepID=UPI001F3E7D2E|nr:hypothetical protein [Vibrio sp. SS-MA-C1-2]UJF18686.1 hypothetical protein L0B53_17015 [Vibrio sp. SS-MA-C1-2]
MNKKLNLVIQWTVGLLLVVSIIVMVFTLYSSYHNPLKFTSWYGYKTVIKESTKVDRRFNSSDEFRLISFEDQQGFFESTITYTMKDNSLKTFHYIVTFDYQLSGSQIIYKNKIFQIIQDDGFWHFRKESKVYSNTEYDVEFFLSQDRKELVTAVPSSMDSLNYYRRTDRF